MKSKIILCLALVLSVVLSGCSSVTKPPQTITVSVSGWVKAPGDYVLPKGASIVAALEAARGFKDSDHSSSLLVVRMVNGQEKKFSVRLHNDSGKLKADFEVMDGDAIYAREVFF
jgi:SLBB domain.